MSKGKVFVPLILLCILSFYCSSQLFSLHADRKDQTFNQLALIPAPVAKVLSLEFTGVAADYLMLQTLTYLGEKLMNKIVPSQEQWEMVYRALERVSYLDTRFLDPYVLAAMTLPWEAGMVEETNELLKKVIKVRPSDHRPFFFLWYNYYYFLHDAATAAHYLKQAARIPGAPGYYTTLAARSSFYGKETEAGILFLKEMLLETTDPTRRKFLLLRLEALEKIAFLEQKIQQYKKLHNALPQTLEQLVEKGLVEKIPQDPYGGEFYIVDREQVYSTSKLVLSGKNAAPQKQ